MSRKPKHSKGLHQKKNGIWELDVRIKGVRRRVDLKTIYLGEAEAQARIELDKLKEQMNCVQGVSFYEFLSRYETWHLPPRKSPTTVEKERNIIRVLKTHYWTKDMAITSITPRMCEDLFTELSRRTSPISGSTVRKPITTETLNMYLVTLRMIFKYAVIWKLILANPFMSLELYKETKKAPRILTEAEQQALFSVIYNRFPKYADIFMFYLWTGLRRSEALKLEWKNIDFEHGFMSITGKNNKVRPVPIFERTRQLLEARRDLIRPFADIPSADAVTHTFVKASALARIDAKLHDLRKTCGTEMASKGVHAFFLKKWLGHVDDETTIGHYIGFIDEDTKKRMEKMGVEKRTELSEMEKEIAQKKALEKIEHQKELERLKRERNHEQILRQKKEYRARHRDEIIAKQREARKKVA